MDTEKVLILAVKKSDDSETRFQSSVEELKSLTYTAGGTVLSTVTQNRRQIHPVTYVGEGKLSEIKQLIEAHEIDLVITNDELSPGQLRNLTDHFNVRVIDRSQLILDIFASRAKTKEGQLQVELAQLQYMLPRLRGMGTVLSRLGGGIGTRGPGETKLETDQRHIRRRIDDIRRRLANVVKQREQYRKRRKEKEAFQIAIVGYTNAGKSTLFNRIANETALEEDLLFATLDPLTRQIHLPSGFKCLLTDTVGFIQDLPTTLIAAFKSTLEEVTEADFLLHVVDASHEDNDEQQKTVKEILRELDADTIPMLTVYNKRDLIEGEFIGTEHPHIIISAYDQADRERLLMKIEELLKQEWQFYSVNLPPNKGNIIYKLETNTIVTNKKFDEENNQYVVAGYIRENHPLQRIIKEHRS